MVLMENKSIKIIKREDSNVYRIKLLKKLPAKKDMEEYHEYVYNIFETEKEFSLIFDLGELNIWSIGLANKEFKFLNEVSEKSEQVKSIAIICSKQITGIIKFFIGKCEQVIPYKFVQNLYSAYEFIQQVEIQNESKNVQCDSVDTNIQSS